MQAAPHVSEPGAARQGTPKKARRKYTEAEGRSLNHQRLADIDRLILGRWGGRVPTGFRNLVAHLVAVHIIRCAGARFRKFASWCERYAPGLSEADLRATFNKASAKGYWYKNRTIGQKLEVTASEVLRFCLTTIAPVSETQAEGDEREKRQRADAQRRRRTLRNIKPRISTAAGQPRPWDAEGVSKATWYRRRTSATQVSQKRA